VVCLCAAPRVQLFVIAGNGWPRNVPRYHQLVPISCHFRDCKALLTWVHSCKTALSQVAYRHLYFKPLLTDTTMYQCWKQNYTKIFQTYARLEVHSAQSNATGYVLRFLSHSHTQTDSSTPQCCLVTFAAASAAFWHPKHSSSQEENAGLRKGNLYSGFHFGGSPGDGRVGTTLKACPQFRPPSWHAALMHHANMAWW